MLGLVAKCSWPAPWINNLRRWLALEINGTNMLPNREQSRAIRDEVTKSVLEAVHAWIVERVKTDGEHDCYGVLAGEAMIEAGGIMMGQHLGFEFDDSDKISQGCIAEYLAGGIKNLARKRRSI